MLKRQYPIMMVIPANAGVILGECPIENAKEGYPRECGGDPKYVDDGEWKLELSPRMRG